MWRKLYFCPICPQFKTKIDNNLRQHLLNDHFSRTVDPKTNEWIDSLVKYESELNRCLSEEPKRLPESSISCVANELMIGCPMCDRIIDCFKLDMSSVNEDKSRECFCEDMDKVVVNCRQCKRKYHWDCVEPNPYSGEETSLYKCFECKKKSFSLSELKLKSKIIQRIHVYHHFNYQPFVCKLTAEDQQLCNESFIRQNFIKVHLKCDHKLDKRDEQLHEYYDFFEIPSIEQFITKCLDLLSSSTNIENNPSVCRPIAQSSTNSTNFVRSLTSNGYSMDNSKRIKTAKDLQLRGFRSPQQKNRKQSFESNQSSSRTSTSGSNTNLEQIVTNTVTNTVQQSTTPTPAPTLTPIRKTVGRDRSAHWPNASVANGHDDRPPVLINEAIVSREDRHREKEVRTQSTPSKGKRGRPPKRRANGLPKTNAQSNGSNGSQNNVNTVYNRTSVFANGYVADGNPNPTRSRLSERARLSRPNISHSREEEKFHRLSTNQLNNKNFVEEDDPKSEESDDSSDWDPETEKFELIQKSSQNGTLISTNGRTTNESKRQSNGSYDSNKTERLRSETPDEDVFASEEPTVDVPLSCSPIAVSCTQTNSPLVTQITRIEDPVSEPQVPTEGISDEVIDVPIEPSIANTSNLSTIFSDWLIHTKPKKYPYFPQINDEVVYIPYGHRQYIDAVRKYHLYRQTNTNKFVNSHLKEIMYAKVKEIKYEKHSNIRLAKLILTVVDKPTNIVTNRVFTLRFHDIDNVIDFIILRQIYDKSMENNWKPGDYFRAIVEDKWWFGTIGAYNMNENNMTTQFQSYSIVWANDSVELLSYWDLEKIKGIVPKNRRASVDITEEERKKFYEPLDEEWPGYGRDVESERIVKGLSQIMELNETKELMKHFNISNPDFVNKIAYPINLNIIRSRVENLFYRRHAAIKYDIKFIESNACLLNPNPNSALVMNARIVVSVCLKFIDELRATHITHIYKKVIEDIPGLSKIKFYSTTRAYLNPNAMPRLTNNDWSDSFDINLLAPFTSSGPNINNQTFDDQNNREVMVIDITDDEDDDTDEVESDDQVSDDPPPEQSSLEVEESSVLAQHEPPVMAEQQSLQHQNSRPPATSPALVIRSQTPPNRSKTPQKALQKSVSKTVPNPTNEGPSAHSDVIPVNYFCIFCSEKFVNRDVAIDHYFNELKVKFDCTQCPQNQKFDSLSQLMAHNDEHIKQIKTSFNTKIYTTAKNWIERMIEYNETLKTESIIRDQIHGLFGDYCQVCRCLNGLTESKQLIEKELFKSRRKSLERTYKSEKDFKTHLRQHLHYEPKYDCTLCAVSVRADGHPNARRTKFSSESIDECKTHLEDKHQLSCAMPDVCSYFSNTKIKKLEELVPNSVNEFIIHCLNY